MESKITNASKKILSERILNINGQLNFLEIQLKDTKEKYEALKAKRESYMVEIVRLKDEKKKIQEDIDAEKNKVNL